MPIFRDLKVRLTEAEWAAIASESAKEQELLEHLEAEKREQASAIKARMDTCEGKIRMLAEKVRTREETRAVECFERKDDRRFVVELYRSDLGTLVEMRPMTAGERHEVMNPPLPLTKSKAKKSAADLKAVPEGEDEPEQGA